MLYALALAAARGEHLSVELALLSLRDLALPSFRTLTPLYGVFGVLIWAGDPGRAGRPVGHDARHPAALLWYLCATYWGPLLVIRSERDCRRLWSAARYDWCGAIRRRRSSTVLVAAVALVVGMVSIGGLVLIVPVRDRPASHPALSRSGARDRRREAGE